MSRCIANILKREYTPYFQNVSEDRIIERLIPSIVIINSKRFTEYCYYKLNGFLSFHFKTKLKRVGEKESRCCWCILMLNDTRLTAKIIHIGRGRFKILNDDCGGIYVNETVDACDVLTCNLDDKQ